MDLPCLGARQLHPHTPTVASCSPAPSAVGPCSPPSLPTVRVEAAITGHRQPDRGTEQHSGSLQDSRAQAGSCHPIPSAVTSTPSPCEPPRPRAKPDSGRGQLRREARDEQQPACKALPSLRARPRLGP